MTLPSKVRRKASLSSGAREAATSARLCAELERLQSMTLATAAETAAAGDFAAETSSDGDLDPRVKELRLIRDALARYSRDTVVVWRNEAARRLEELGTVASTGSAGTKPASACASALNKRKAEGSLSATSDLKQRDKRSTLNHTATHVLTTWLLESPNAPYPKAHERDELCAQSGLSTLQIKNWYVFSSMSWRAPVERYSRGHALASADHDCVFPSTNAPPLCIRPGLQTAGKGTGSRSASAGRRAAGSTLPSGSASSQRGSSRRSAL